jgi:hypothetical protein
MIAARGDGFLYPPRAVLSALLLVFSRQNVKYFPFDYFPII